MTSRPGARVFSKAASWCYALAPGMAEESPNAELARTRRERDLYRRLLHLGQQNELGPLLKEALALVVEVTGARQGYLEIQDDDDRVGRQPWWMSHGFSADEVEAV